MKIFIVIFCVIGIGCCDRGGPNIQVDKNQSSSLPPVIEVNQYVVCPSKQINSENTYGIFWGVVVRPNVEDISLQQPVIVKQVIRGSPADLAQIRAGDRIVSFNDRVPLNAFEFYKILSEIKQSSSVIPFVVTRKSYEMIEGNTFVLRVMITDLEKYLSVLAKGQ